MNTPTADRPRMDIRPVFLLMTTTLLLAVGDRLITTSAVWRVVERTQSAVAASFVLMVPTVVGVAVAPSIGFLLDNRNRGLTISKVFVVAAIVVMAAGVTTIGAFGWRYADILAAVVILAIVAGVGRVNDVGVATILPGVVPSEHLSRFNGTVQLLRNAGRSIGPVIGAFLVARFGILSSVASYGVVLAICATSAWMLLKRVPPTQIQKVGLRERRVIVRNMLYNSVVLAYVVVGALANGSIQAFSVAIPFRSIEVSGENITFYGLLQAAYQGGMLVAGVFLGICGLARKIGNSSLTISVGLLGMAMAYWGIALAGGMLPLVAGAVLSGVMLVWVSIFADTCWQLRLSEEVRGLTVGIVYAVLSVLRPVGAAIAGVITENVSASAALGVFGGLLLLCGVAVGVFRPFDAGNPGMTRV
ncbi:major facilitator superfamily MFS_1 [Thermaerobacter marianensis DSM 12885]|uniref:Major facilitator superfamily MFS_1 n=1 Tax=Thermaerobacter marianensis (strain ATCC 700841 / DSM 12885 / JCM 10246 / 7p75a) TaxID=644966 RepID=E6SIP9_THEM7|nr:MFS transporter [Thermaerobacter marianensis]ADU51993.1 major facilitator superfamily MFS_1 [Thermaerobacter marianensis DSM 12885]